MNLSLRSLKHSFLRWVARRNPTRLRAVQAFLDATDERYLDADLWSKMRGLSREEALRQLEAGVKMRLLEKCFLYEWSDAPVRFLVPASALGNKIRLSDVGYIGEDDDVEVLISKNRVRPVFIASESGE